MAFGLVVDQHAAERVAGVWVDDGTELAASFIRLGIDDSDTDP